MAAIYHRPRWGDIVLQRAFTAAPETQGLLAEFLLDTINSQSDGEAMTKRIIDEIASSGQEGRLLLEQTRQRDDNWFTPRTTAVMTISVARVRAMIASRLCR